MTRALMSESFINPEYTIMLYDRPTDIPPGQWGFYQHKRCIVGWPTRLEPYYSYSEDELLQINNYRVQHRNEMLSNSAPVNFETLLLVCDQNNNNPEINQERARIIGNTIVKMDIASGQSFRVSRLEKISKTGIAIKTDASVYFEPGHEHRLHGEEVFEFEADNIWRYELDYSYNIRLNGFVIERKPILEKTNLAYLAMRSIVDATVGQRIPNKIFFALIDLGMYDPVLEENIDYYRQNRWSFLNNC